MKDLHHNWRFYFIRLEKIPQAQAIKLCVLCTIYHYFCRYLTLLSHFLCDCPQRYRILCSKMTCSPNAVCIPINHGASTRSAQAAQRHVITRPQPHSQLAPRYAIHFHASLTAPRVTHNLDTYRRMHVLGSSRLLVTVPRRNDQSLQVVARVMAAIGCSESYVCIKRGHVPTLEDLVSQL
jgi:hypothetical protein